MEILCLVYNNNIDSINLEFFLVIMMVLFLILLLHIIWHINYKQFMDVLDFAIHIA